MSTAREGEDAACDHEQHIVGDVGNRGVDITEHVAEPLDRLR
jgi:hypothetical protein